MRRIGGLLVFFIPVLMLSALGCAQKRPVLYPNAHLQQVGGDQARADMDDCGRLAKQYTDQESAAGRVAKQTGIGAAIGAAMGAAVGAVFGSAGSGAAAGAAAGGVGSLASGAIESRNPDEVYRQFVDRCLRDRGYEPIGWQ